MKYRSFSARLLINFALSTFIPFLVIIILVANIIQERYQADTQTLMRSHMESLSRNVLVYLNELQQATLMPYYNEDFSYYLSSTSKKDTIHYLEKAKIRQSLNNLLSFVRYTRPDLQSVVIVTPEDCLYYTTSLVDCAPKVGYVYRQEPWYQQGLAGQGSVSFVSPHVQAYFDNTKGQLVFSLVRALIHLRTREPYAVVKVDATPVVFKDILNNASFHVPSQVFLSDDNRQLIYSRSGNNAALSDFLHDVSSANIVMFQGKPMLYSELPVGNYGWSLHVLLDQNALNQRIWYVYAIGGSLYLIGGLVALLFHLGISRRQVRALQGIRQTLEQVQQGNFAARYTPQEPGDLDVLGDAINHMALQLQNLIEQEYLSTIRQQHAEMRALQSQIQPHFLFNTLGSLVALNQAGEQALLETSLFQLSALMRYVLDHRESVPLCEELDFLHSYFALQKLRFNDRFTFAVQTEPALENIVIPRLLLQPFAENALIHGIEPCKRTCHVLVKAAQDERTIHIYIQDDGKGFANEKPTAHLGIGVENSRQRLALTYPSSAITIESRTGRGCRVHIQIPRQEEKV